MNARGEILLASQAIEGLNFQGLRSHLAVMTSAGIVTRTLAVAGPAGDQTIEGLATTSDGAVWIEVSSTARTDEDVHLVLDGRDFTEPGTYLFKLVP